MGQYNDIYRLHTTCTKVLIVSTFFLKWLKFLFITGIFVWPSPVVDEGTNVNISCFPSGSQECNNIFWEKDEVRLNRSGLLRFYNISRNSSGNYLCSADSDHQTFTSNATITVQCKIYNVIVTVDILTSLIFCCSYPNFFHHWYLKEEIILCKDHAVSN